MKRNKNLHPLSWEHHHALTSVVLTRRHIQNNEPIDRLVRTAHEFVAFHRENLIPHFRHEEEVVLPMYLRYVDEDTPDVIRVLTDHIALHYLICRVGEAATLQNDLVEALIALTDRLEAHVRFEERELFPKIEAALTEDQLSEIGSVLAEESPEAVVIPGGDGCKLSVTPKTRDSDTGLRQ